MASAKGSVMMDLGVGGGELEAVEEAGGAFGVDSVKSEGGDEEGDGDLDGFCVFEGGEVDLGEFGGGGGVAGEESGREGGDAAIFFALPSILMGWVKLIGHLGMVLSV